MIVSLLVLAVSVLVVSLVGLVLYYRRRLAQLDAATRRRARKVDDSGARAVIKGQVAEQLAPILPGFPYLPSDFRFLGQPIDYICYVGLTECKDAGGDIREVVIGDIKMGGARLSRHQQAIKRAIDEGRVRWETLHIDQDFQVARRTK